MVTVEPARARRIDGARNVPFEDDRLTLPPELGIRDRNRGQERARIRVLRLAVQRLAVGNLGDLPEIHDHHAVRDVSDDIEIVGDEDVRQPEVVLQVLQQVEDLRLDGNVEGGDGLVADDQLRVDGERPRDADALALTA